MVIVNANNKKTAQLLNNLINDANHVFILVYLNGCGPCNATRPEWKKMSDVLKNKYDSQSDIAILDLDSQYMNDVEQIGDVNSFPTIKYLNPKKKIIEDYENSNISSKDRSSKSFITWIESKILSDTKMQEDVTDLLKKISKDDENFSFNDEYDDENLNSKLKKNKKIMILNSTKKNGKLNKSKKMRKSNKSKKMRKFNKSNKSNKFSNISKKIKRTRKQKK